jgi:PAS domain S-box-containing protein
MEPVGRTLRQVFGRTKFGFYAFRDDEARVELVASSSGWPPPGVTSTAAVQGVEFGRGLPSGRLHPISGGGSRDASTSSVSNIACLPIGEEEKRRGGLLVHAGPRSAVWRWSSEDWDTLSSYLDAYLQHEALRRAFDSLRGFHEVLLETLPLGVFAIDRSGRVTYLSPPAETILGYKRDDAIGTDYRRIFRPAGVDENPLLQGLRGKAKNVELYIADRQGQEKPVWMQMTRIPGRSGEGPRGLIVLIRDTSEDRLFEEEQRRRERLASIGELAAGVAHEIRNPLTGIANCGQVLRDRLTPDDPRLRFVHIILDETSRLNRIVDSLLSFARPGQPSLRESAVTETLRKVQELEEERACQQGVTTECKIRGRIPRIFIDPEQITQVLLNVIRNALEAMPSGGKLSLECSVIRRRPHRRRGTGQRKTDRIRYSQTIPMRRFVQISVSDTGKGIPRDVVPRVFDPFFTTRTKGTGLGLSISQSIIKEHGGFISLRSIEDKGTTVSIELPVERRQADRRKQGG